MRRTERLGFYPFGRTTMVLPRGRPRRQEIRMKKTKGTGTARGAPSREENVLKPRTVERLVAGTATADGAGVKLTRILHGALQQRLDPFRCSTPSEATIRTTTSPGSPITRTAASRR